MMLNTISTARARWDAGETGCSQLIVGIRSAVGRLAPGEVLEVVARDPSAVIDIGVWCGMTGHRLVSAAHPIYVLQRKDD